MSQYRLSSNLCGLKSFDTMCGLLLSQYRLSSNLCGLFTTSVTDALGSVSIPPQQ